MTTNTQFINRVLELTNEYRAANGLNPLTLNQELNASAYGHSRDMAQLDFFDHIGLDGSKPSDRNLEVGYDANRTTENIAGGRSTPEGVMDQWKNSEGHNENLLDPKVTELGVGYFYLENDTGVKTLNHYWTQVFGSGDTNPETNIPEDVLAQIGPATPNAATPAVEPATPEVQPPVIAPEDLSNQIIGTEGNDVLTGTPGNDLIFGEGGADIINGYSDNIGEIDILTGGAGADTFVIDMSIYAYAEEGHAIITDFEKGIDRLDLTGFEDYVTLGTSMSNNGVDTLISENDDLLAVVQGVELSQNDFNNSII